jgi:hypothetical protein
LENILKLNVYVTSVDMFPAVNEVYRRYFPELGMAASTSRWTYRRRSLDLSIVTLIAIHPMPLWAGVRRLLVQNSFALSTLADIGRQAIGKRMFPRA